MKRYTLYIDGNKEEESDKLYEICETRKIFLNTDNWELAKEVKPFWPWEKKAFFIKEVWVTPSFKKARTIVIVDNEPNIDMRV